MKSKKIALKLDALEVESFDTSPRSFGQSRGTVKGFEETLICQTIDDTCGCEMSLDIQTCEQTCVTCFNPGCPTITCGFTCTCGC